MTLDASKVVATLDCRTLGSRALAIVELRNILYLLEHHPEQVDGMVIWREAEGEGLAFHVKASLRPMPAADHPADSAAAYFDRPEPIPQNISGGQNELQPSVPPPSRSTVISGERSLSDVRGRSR